MKRAVNIAAVLTVAGALALAGCGRNPKEPGYEVLPDMARSIPYDAFAPNPNTPDGKTLQAPPDGSIPRGFLPYRYGTTTEEAERAGRELKNPVPATPANLARGKKVFETFCAVCHGVQGKGDGPLIPKFPNPPSFTSKAVREYPEGRLFHIATQGSGLMPPHASQISEEDRWKLVHYVRTLQKPAGQAETETRPAETQGANPP